MENEKERFESSLRQIRTFQGDVAEALKRQQESLVSIQRREQIKVGPRVSPEEEAINKKRHQFVYLLLGSAILFVLGGAGAWFGYQEFMNRTVSPIISGPANRFFSPSSSVDLELSNFTREMVLSSVDQARTTIPAGAVEHLVLKKVDANETSLVTTEEFLKLFGSQAPGALVRAFDPLFMLGAIGTSSTTTVASTFVVIKLTSFENAYDGMLEWEPKMAQDLGPILGTHQALTAATSTLFTDLTDRNKDLRVLSTNGMPVMLYSFFDSNMLIITDRIDTMHTVIELLTREKLSR